MRLLVVINPHAAGGRPLRHQAHMEARLRQAGHEVRVFVTPDVAAMQRQIHEAATTVEGVLVAGGDGTLHQAHPAAKALTSRVLEACPRARRFYDINLRRDSYSAPLVEELMLLADVVKLNDAEAAEVGRMSGVPCGTLAQFCRYWSERCGWSAACVTLGAQGCVVLAGEDLAEVPGYAVQVQDAVGAGDAFAAAFLHGLSQGWPAAEIGDFSNRVGALVASRPGAVPNWTLEESRALARRPTA